MVTGLAVRLVTYLMMFALLFVFAVPAFLGRVVYAGSLAFQSDYPDGNYEVYFLDINTGVVVNFTRHEAEDGTPAWSVDERVAFTSRRDGDPDIYVYDMSTHQVTNGEGANVRRVTDQPGDDRSPAWSPDGRLAFASSHDGNSKINLMDVSTGQTVGVSLGEASTYALTWSRDRRLAFIRYQAGEGSAICVFDVNFSRITLVRRAPGVVDLDWLW